MLAGGAYAARGYLLDDTVASSCQGSVPVRVIASPDIAPVLNRIVEGYQGDAAPQINGTCITAEIAAVPSAEVVLGLGGEVTADLWVPESSMWTDRLSAADVSLGEPTSIAVSPLVVVAPRPVAQQIGWPDTAFSWSAVLGGEATATIADPMNTSEGLATLLAVRAAVGADAEATQLVAAMTAISEAAVPTVAAAYEQVSADVTAAPLFTATEQSVVAYNQTDPQTTVVALYPSEGTALFDYPAIPVAGPESTSTTEAAVARLVELFTTEEAIAQLQGAGFRSVDGTASDTAGVVDGIQAQMPSTMPTPSAEEAGALLRQWAALSLEMRMLAVIDTSGSMWETDNGEQTRIELVRDAARTALELFPPTSSVGLWAFSTDEDPPNHWVELAEIGPLTDQDGDDTRLQQLLAAADALPQREVRGWTALYDTTLAAFQEVTANYEAGKVNTVVLMTDGTDERAPELAAGIDLETLLSNLQSIFDPAKPVAIITIGIGPAADMEALEAISAATGGTAYRAENPADIQQVFLHAMTERQCRPNC